MDEGVLRPELPRYRSDSFRDPAEQPTSRRAYRALLKSRLYNVAQIPLSVFVTEQRLTTSADTGVRNSTRQSGLADSTECGSSDWRFCNSFRSDRSNAPTCSCNSRIARYGP